MERPVEFVMFHAFKARDEKMERQIALAAGSMRLHYPEARIVLLTNPQGLEATLPEWIERMAAPTDFSALMFARACAYRDHARKAQPGTRLVFLDTDMLVIRRFDELLTPSADLSVTIRNIAPAPVNGGLIVADMTRHALVADFFERFVQCFEELPEAEKQWDGDQSALRILLDAPAKRITEIMVVERDGLSVRMAPAQVFNHTPRRLLLRLGLFRPGARILHFKGGRKARMEAYARRYLSATYRAFQHMTGG